MNPPIVYEKPQCSHQENHNDCLSMLHFNSFRAITLSRRISTQCLSSFFLVGLGSGVNRATAMTDELLSLFDDSVGCVPQPFSLLIQVINRLPAALAQRFACFFAREQHGHHPADDP